MKIYETAIPETWPFRFAIVGKQLVNVEERAVHKTTQWWSKKKGYYKEELFSVVDGVRHYTDLTLLIPSFNVPKEDYEALIFDEWLDDLMIQHDEFCSAKDIKEANLNIIKKDWIDHWEVGAALREEIVLHSHLINRVDTIFR